MTPSIEKNRRVRLPNRKHTRIAWQGDFLRDTERTDETTHFQVLRKDRIAHPNGADLDALLSPVHGDSDRWHGANDPATWRPSPLFAVVKPGRRRRIRLRAQVSKRIASRRNYRISSNQLQWITVAGKAEADHMRVVLEGRRQRRRSDTSIIRGHQRIARPSAGRASADRKVRQELR